VPPTAADELLLRREAYDRVADALLGPGEVLHAPDLIDAEIAQVFTTAATTPSDLESL
jgi:hypothetical protein